MEDESSKNADKGKDKDSVQKNKEKEEIKKIRDLFDLMDRR